MKTIKILVSIYVLLASLPLNINAQETSRPAAGARQAVVANRDTSFSNEKLMILYRIRSRIPELTFDPENIGINLLNSSRNYLALMNEQAYQDSSKKSYQGYNENINGYGLPYSFSIRMAGLSGKPLFSPDENFYNLSVSGRHPLSAHRQAFYNNPVYRTLGEVFNASMRYKYRIKDN